MEELKGFFKMCAGCSIKEKRADLKNGQFYCKVKGGIVYATTDAFTCDGFDWKNVIKYTQKEIK